MSHYSVKLSTSALFFFLRTKDNYFSFITLFAESEQSNHQQSRHDFLDIPSISSQEVSFQDILDVIETKKAKFAQAPLFQFMQDQHISPLQRLGFAPCIAHFILSFGDLNKYVFRDESSNDVIQELINEHTYEDDHH